MQIDLDSERARWAASADSWDRWADPMAELADKLNRPLLDAAGVGPGACVLDLASGAGEPALSAARRAGPDGLVVGSDLVPAMLAGAVRRAAAVDGAAPAFTAADMTALPFADASFDCVTCRFGIMFVPDAAAALAEIVRVLKPGGSLGLMVWGPRTGNALFDVIAEAVQAVLGEDGSIGPLFRFAEPGVLTGLMRQAGFAGTNESEITPVRKAPLSEPFWRAPLEMSFGHRLAGLSTGERAAVEAEVVARFGARAADGLVPLPMHVRLVTGRK